jgi:hypothetical protein
LLAILSAVNRGLQRVDAQTRAVVLKGSEAVSTLKE